MPTERPDATPPVSAAKKLRPHPKVATGKDGQVNIETVDLDMFRELFGVQTHDVAAGLMVSAIDALGENASRYYPLMAALPAELEPRDAIEGMLCVQMGATHVAITTLNQRMLHAKSWDLRESLERSVTRLSRTYLAQMEALRKHRSKAQQTVRVERVTVNEGGQAIVGDVTHRGAG